MSTFDVKSPDGRTFRVTAPDGTPKEEVMARVQAQAQASPPQGRSLPKPPPAAAKKPRTLLQTAGDFIGDVADNILPNWGDEISAAAVVSGANPANPMTWPKAAYNVARRAVQGEDIAGWFRGAQKDFKDSQAQYDREHPNLAWGSTIGGTVAGLALPGGAAVKGARLGTRAVFDRYESAGDSQLA